jgi:hypothetical protein
VENFGPEDLQYLLDRELRWLEVLLELDRHERLLPARQFARFVRELVIKGRFRELRN